MKSKSWIAYGVVLTLLALCLRVPGALASGLWRDEAECAAIAGLPTWSDVLWFLSVHESHPPAFYGLLRLGQALGIRRDSELALLSVAMGAAQVSVSMALVRRAAGSRAGLLAGLLVAISAPLVKYSAQVRPYALLPLLGLLAVIALLRLHEGRAHRIGWPLYVIVNAAMLYTHNWAILFWFAQGVVVLAWTLQSADRRHALWPTLHPWALAHATILGLWLPWLPTLRFQIQHAGHGAPGLATTLPGRFLVPLGVTALPPVVQCALVAGAFATPPVIAIIASHRRGRSLLPSHTLPIAVLLGIPYVTYATVLALSPIADLSPGRCNLPSRLLLLLGCVALAHQSRRAILPFLAAALALTGVWILPQVVGMPQTNAQLLCVKVAAQRLPADLIYVAPATIAPTVYRYLPAGADMTVYPNLPPVERGFVRRCRSSRSRRFELHGGVKSSTRRVFVASKRRLHHPS